MTFVHQAIESTRSTAKSLAPQSLLLLACLSLACIKHRDQVSGEIDDEPEGSVLSMAREASFELVAGATIRFDPSLGLRDDYLWSVDDASSVFIHDGVLALGQAGLYKVTATSRSDAGVTVTNEIEVHPLEYLVSNRIEFGGADNRSITSASLTRRADSLALGHSLQGEFAAVGLLREAEAPIYQNLLPEPELPLLAVVPIHAIALGPESESIYSSSTNASSTPQLLRHHRNSWKNRLELDSTWMPTVAGTVAGLAVETDVDGDTLIWAAVEGSPKSIVSLSDMGTVIDDISLPMAIGDDIVGLSFSASGQLLLATTRAIYELDPEETGDEIIQNEIQLGAGAGFITDLATDSLGRLFVSVQDVAGRDPVGTIRVFNAAGIEIDELDGPDLGLLDPDGMPRSIERPLALAAASDGSLCLYEGFESSRNGISAQLINLSLGEPPPQPTLSLSRSSGLLNIGWSMPIEASAPAGSTIVWESLGGALVPAAGDSSKARYITGTDLGTWAVRARISGTQITASATITTTATNFDFSTAITGSGTDSHQVHATAAGGGGHYYVGYINESAESSHFIQRRDFAGTIDIDSFDCGADVTNCAAAAYPTLINPKLVNVTADALGSAYWVDEDSSDNTLPVLYRWPVGTDPSQIEMFTLSDPTPRDNDFLFKGGLCAAPPVDASLYSVSLYVALDVNDTQNEPYLVRYDLPLDVSAGAEISHSVRVLLPPASNLNFDTTYSLAVDETGAILIASWEHQEESEGDNFLLRLVPDATFASYSVDATFAELTSSLPQPPRVSALATDQNGLSYVTTIDGLYPEGNATLWVLDVLGNIVESHNFYEGAPPGAQGRFGYVHAVAASPEGTLRLVDDVYFDTKEHDFACFGIEVERN
ncbi:MAG: hypothetical protein ACI841_002031 [Planctomycetota bacterium]|jgi:hypothetical protein